MDRKRPLFISFSTQKGGAGKSVFTTLAASHFHYTCNLNVLVVDCDKGQHSLHRMRERDQEIVESDPIHKEQFHLQLERTAKPAYPILCTTASDALDVTQNFLAGDETEYDLVLFDMVGSVESDGVMACVAGLDYIFAPITSDHLALESSLAFALAVKELLLDNPSQPLKGIYLFWNKVVATERTTLYDDYATVIKNFELSMLNTYIPDIVRYKRELRRGRKGVFRSTLFPVTPSQMKGCRFDELIEEITQILKLEIDNGKE